MRRWQLKLGYLLAGVFVAIGVTMLVLIVGGWIDSWEMVGLFIAFTAYALFFFWVFGRLYRSAQRDIGRKLEADFMELFKDGQAADQGRAGDTGEAPKVLPDRADG